MNKSRIPWFGVALVVIGIAILLDKSHIVELDLWTVFWPLMMLLALMSVARGFSQDRARRGRIFGGTVWFLYSLFFFLRASDFVEIRAHMFVPATFAIIGIAFLMLVVNDLRDWYFLVPAILLFGAGVVLMIAAYGMIEYWDVWEVVRTWWPVVLILFGVAMLFCRRQASPPPTNIPAA